MKLDIVKTIIAIGISALISYGLYCWNISEGNLLIPIFGFIELSILSISALGLNVSWVRSMANAKITAWLFLIISIAINIVFDRNTFGASAYIVSNGILLLLFLLIYYSLLRANK